MWNETYMDDGTLGEVTRARAASSILKTRARLYLANFIVRNNGLSPREREDSTDVSA